MNNYKLASELRKLEGCYYRMAAGKVESARVDVAVFHSQYGRLPFNGIHPEVVRTIEGMIEEEAEPDSGISIVTPGTLVAS